MSTTTRSGPPALEVQELTVSWPHHQVLQGVNVTVHPGEIVAVVGASGAGKSVLARALLGLVEREGGRVAARRLQLGPLDMTHASPRQWRRARGSSVALVQQDALQSLDPLRTVEAETGEALAVRRIRPRRDRVRAALIRAGLADADTLLRRLPGQLSGGMRQRAVIAGALTTATPLLVADEPTTALDATTGRHVLGLLRALADDGAGVLLISHDLAAVSAVADRITVLDQGRIVEEGPAARLLAHPASAAARALVAAAPRGPKPGPPPPDDAAVLLAGRGLTRRYAASSAPAVDAVDVTVRAGSVLGIVGESGSGKTTLARLLLGAEVPDAGRVERPSGPVRLRMVPQDPLGSFDPRWTVQRILATSRRDDAPNPAELLRQVGLDTGVLSRYPAVLSGGQRQRVAIARALAGRPRVLVCDEPVSALDVVTQAGILDLLRHLQTNEGLAMVFVSHDLAVVRQVADDVLVMRGGRVVERGRAEDVFLRPRHPFTRELVG